KSLSRCDAAREFTGAGLGRWTARRRAHKCRLAGKDRRLSNRFSPTLNYLQQGRERPTDLRMDPERGRADPSAMMGLCVSAFVPDEILIVKEGEQKCHGYLGKQLSSHLCVWRVYTLDWRK